ncbi:hypothetical protein FH609_012005 [Streptomyces sp. 3MP-14]|uniref:Uncharacterized protein n=1 Tax=Streptomyces mimosae TaxID=2586635 RepID=A0A5N6AE72_9ACTN|nr:MULTISPECIES: hypothetical protein [Streptomyces]KAB8167114.1 hypothetical protein FH607_009455 [Streptomyces mimosae]KAB8177055.1 hypothetical protein FH609_012005 [Streptomyces sp. 3MP-14]
MSDETGLRDHLADLAESGRRQAAPLAAERIRAHGERRLRRRRAAQASGGALLVAALAVGGLSLVPDIRGQEPPAGVPTATASPFVPPAPAPGEEYGTELGYVHGAVANGDGVRITVEQLRDEEGTLVPVGVEHTLTLPGRTPVEARRLAGGEPAVLELGELVDELADEARWVFAIDYDDRGRVQSLREAYWLVD